MNSTCAPIFCLPQRIGYLRSRLEAADISLLFQQLVFVHKDLPTLSILVQWFDEAKTLEDAEPLYPPQSQGCRARRIAGTITCADRLHCQWHGASVGGKAQVARRQMKVSPLLDAVQPFAFAMRPPSVSCSHVATLRIQRRPCLVLLKLGSRRRLRCCTRSRLESRDGWLRLIRGTPRFLGHWLHWHFVAEHLHVAMPAVIQRGPA
mmetsp:Transcript_52232/g.144618  ORF Transcript_52232/g.144618 Transcript_52232/m.144618 type:complete len:206 (-) Transcript_52232:13-630(-)